MNFKTVIAWLVMSCFVTGPAGAADGIGKGASGGFTGDTASTAGMPAGGRGGVMFYDATDVPAETPLKDVVVDRSNWCSISNEQVQAWKQEWDRDYKGKVVPACANFFMEWKKKAHCEGRPAGKWKATTKWMGEGRNISDLPMNIDEFLQQKKCTNCNLNLVGFQCLNLNGVDFSGSSLERVDFQYAELRNADFSNANLKAAVMHGGDLTHANFAGSQVDEAVMTSTALKGANFAGATLENVDLQQADLKNADFRGATLKNVSLVNADVRNADFSGATLQDVDLDGVDKSAAINLPARKIKRKQK